MTDLSAFSPSRRDLLLGAGAFTAWNAVPRVAAGAPIADPRLIVLVLKGGMDGLTVVAPVGDPHYREARDGLLLPDSGAAAALPLDSHFALHPYMKSVHALYTRRQALFFHAIATPYRSRSHFDGQDVLQSGFPEPGHRRSGWLNRALASLPARTLRTGGLAVAPRVPVILRGSAPVSSWLPRGFHDSSSDTRDRLMDLYRHTDPDLGERLATALKLDEEISGGKRMTRSGGKSDKRGIRLFKNLARAAARIMNRDGGPRVGAMDLSGWDTHASETPVRGRFARQIMRLDAMLGTLAEEMGEKWRDTTVLVVTEFGRTVHMNGTAGTDHGTATVAMALGGAVDGGRVIADWPGLAPGDLYEGRDLKPTTDLRAVCKAILAEQFSVPERALAETVFPGSAAVAPMPGVIRT